MMPLDDRGLTLGDGLFETILARDGELVLLDDHLARLSRGCAALGLPAPDLVEAGRLCREAAQSVEGRAAVRLTLTAGSGGRGLDRPAAPTARLFATAAPAPRPTTPARLVTASVRRNEGSLASRLKTLAYLDNILAREEARAAGADEALMLNNAGEIACAAAANIFWVKGETLFTPALDCGVLDGVIRGRVLEAAPKVGLRSAEVCASADEIAAADEVFLTSSLIGLRAVADLDGFQPPNRGVAGRLADLLQSLA